MSATTLFDLVGLLLALLEAVTLPTTHSAGFLSAWSLHRSMSNEPVICREKFSCVLVHLLHVASRSHGSHHGLRSKSHRGESVGTEAKPMPLARRGHLQRGQGCIELMPLGTSFPRILTFGDVVFERVKENIKYQGNRVTRTPQDLRWSAQRGTSRHRSAASRPTVNCAIQVFPVPVGPVISAVSAGRPSVVGTSTIAR